MSKKTVTTMVGVSLMLSALALVFASGIAAAHTCQAAMNEDPEEVCDNCDDGKTHSHTWNGQPYCSSTADPDPDPQSCKVLGFELPRWICDGPNNINVVHPQAK